MSLCVHCQPALLLHHMAANIIHKTVMRTNLQLNTVYFMAYDYKYHEWQNNTCFSHLTPSHTAEQHVEQSPKQTDVYVIHWSQCQPHWELHHLNHSRGCSEAETLKMHAEVHSDMYVRTMSICMFHSLNLWSFEALKSTGNLSLAS